MALTNAVFCTIRPKYLLSLSFIVVTVGVFLFAHPSRMIGFTVGIVPLPTVSTVKVIKFVLLKIHFEKKR